MSRFKLINFFEDPKLNGLRFEMGATLVRPYVRKRTVTLLDEDGLRRLGKEGIDVDDFSEIKIEPDGTLSYKGARVVVYIRDVKEYKEEQKLPRFHFAYCTTLQNMQKNSRWHRYVVANRDDGAFTVNFVGDKTISRTLNLAVCQNCLTYIGWEGFHHQRPKTEKTRIVETFSLQTFFQKYPKDILSVVPTYTVDTAPLNDYTEDWGLISEAVKNKNGYKCEKCGLGFAGDDRSFLHTHHRDGQKDNNSEENLEVLCIGCHSEEYMHSHLKQLKRYQEFVQKYSR